MCSIHWGYLVIILAYLAFMGFWMIGRKHRSYDGLIGFATALNIIIGGILTFFAKCPLCWGFICIDLFILCIFAAYFVVRQIKDNKEAVIRAIQAAERKREAEALRLERKKAKKEAELVAATVKKDDLEEQNVTSKAAICQYLTKTYGNRVVLNARSELSRIDNYFAEADAHYAVIDRRKICFAYVYQNDEKGMALLVRMKESERDLLAEKHAVTADKDVKGGNWTKVVVDSSFAEEEIFDILSESYRLASEEKLPAANVTFDKVDKVNAVEVDAFLSDEDALALVEHSLRTPDKTQRGTINIEDLNKYFSAGDTVTLDVIKRRVPGFDKNMTYCKVLARGVLEKPLIADLDDYSLGSIKMLLVTGGRVFSTRG